MIAGGFDAIILAGGRASRLGGADKTALLYRGRSLLRTAVDAAHDALTIVIVGLRDGAEVPPGVLLTCETPPRSGPAAAIAAGLAGLRASASDYTLVLAADQPLVADAVECLFRATAAPGDGLIAVDPDGKRQPLLALYRTGALRRAVEARGGGDALAGMAVRRLIEPLALREVPLPGELCADVDTPRDLDVHGIRLEEVGHGR